MNFFAGIGYSLSSVSIRLQSPSSRNLSAFVGHLRHLQFYDSVVGLLSLLPQRSHRSLRFTAGSSSSCLSLCYSDFFSPLASYPLHTNSSMIDSQVSSDAKTSLSCLFSSNSSIFSSIFFLLRSLDIARSNEITADAKSSHLQITFSSRKAPATDTNPRKT